MKPNTTQPGGGDTTHDGCLRVRNAIAVYYAQPTERSMQDLVEVLNNATDEELRCALERIGNVGSILCGYAMKRGAIPTATAVVYGGPQDLQDSDPRVN